MKNSSQKETFIDALKVIKNTYDALTDNYDELYGYEQTIKHLEIIKKVNLSNKKILDAGAGTLLLEKTLLSLRSKDNYWIVALDISEVIRKPYQDLKHNEKIDSVIGDITNIPFRNEAFNIVLSITVLGGLGELIKKAATNMINTCKKEGKIIITIHEKTISKIEKAFLDESCVELWKAGVDIGCTIEKT